VSAFDSDMERLEREAFRTSNDTGFEELTVAATMLSLAWVTLAFRLVGPSASQHGSWLAGFAQPIIIVPPILALVWLDRVKAREITQRLGTFKPSRARRRRQRLARIIPVAVVAAALTLALLEFGAVPQLSAGRSAVCVVAFGVSGLIVAWLTEQPRQRYLGWVAGLGFACWLGFGSGLVTTAGMTAVGLVFLAVGLVVLRRFRRQHPVLETAGLDVRA
jgi:hypothetical protein